MGFLDIPAPLLGALDALIAPLPAWLRLTVWAIATGAAMMLLYRICVTQIIRRSGNRPLAHFAAGAVALFAAATVGAFVNHNYAYQFPQPGGYVHAHSMPEIPLADLSALATDPESAFLVNYPYEGETGEVIAANGEFLLKLPMQAPVPNIQKRQWWNWLIGNPNGYLPDDYEIEMLHVMLKKRSYLPFGPDWMRGWAFTYFVLAAVAAVAVRVGWWKT